MLDLAHRHVVMTLSHQLNELIKNNKNELLSALMRVSADTLKDWIKHKYNIIPGIISVLHTFGETKDYHVHVHMIVSWGGIHKKSSALEPIEQEYVNYDFLKKKFMCKFEDVLIALFDKHILQHPFSNRKELLSFIKNINQKR